MWRFRNDNMPFSREGFKDTRIQDAIIETYLSYLEERFIEIEILSKRFNNLTKGERNAMSSLKGDKTVIIKCGDKGVGVIYWTGRITWKKQIHN